MTIAEEIGIIAGHLPEKNQALVLELIKTMIPLDDEPLTDEEEAEIIQIREEMARGEYYTHEEVWGKK